MSGIDPQTYFASKNEGAKPRCIWTVGIAGSGKSFWVGNAKALGWEVISADEIRVLLLKQMRDRKEKVMTRAGISELADPSQASHIFSPSLRLKGLEAAYDRAQEAMQNRKALVLDMTNIGPQRIPFLILARAQDYFCEALVFEPLSLDQHLENIESRVQSGGLDIASKSGPEGIKERREILETLLETFEIFSRDLKTEFSARKSEFRNELPDPRPWIGKVLQSHKVVDPAIAKYDVFDRVLKVLSFSRDS